MKIKELREKNVAELEKILLEKREVIRKVRFEISTKQVKNNRDIRNAKRDVARVLTLLKEKVALEQNSL